MPSRTWVQFRMDMSSIGPLRSPKLAHLYEPGCKALLDRISDQAHIIETGTESFRFRRPLERSNNGWAGGPGRDV
jgi:hypothetical protein